MLHLLVPRMVFIDLVKTTLLAFVGVTAVVTLGGAMVEAVRQGLNPIVVLRVIPYLVPPTLPYTLPTCILFSCTVVYGRMSSNLEITALKAGGIHTFHIIAPAIVLSVAASGLGIYMGNEFIPSCSRRMREIILADIQSNIYSVLKQFGSLPTDPNFPYETYVRDVRGDRLINPIFKRRNRAGDGYDVVATSSEATLQVIPAGVESDQTLVELRLIEGIATTDGSQSQYFRDETFKMPIPLTGRDGDEKMETLTFKGCLARAESETLEAMKLDMELASISTSAMLSGQPQIAARVTTWNRDQADRRRRKAREAEAELHMRLAQAVVAIPFVLLGCPVGILYQRRDFLQTFFICFLPIVTLYYPMTILSFNVYKEGVGALTPSVWGPTALLLLISVPFLKKLVRY